MSNNLVPIRKFAYIFDRQHFGMIGTVTQRDTSLGWGGNAKGPSRRGKTARRGHKTSREVALSGVMDMTGLPAMPVPCVQGLDIPRSVTPRFGNRRCRICWWI